MAERGTDYRSLLRTRGVIPLYGVGLASRMAEAMWLFTLTLLALSQYRSPQLAGIIGFASLAPALPVGLLAGALLDRHGRRRLIAADQALSLVVASAAYFLLTAGVLSPAFLVTLTALGAITLPLTQIGTRSLKPLLVPRELWDRANALDNAVTGGAYFAGVGLSGLLYAQAGPAAPLLAVALLWAVGAVLALTMPEARRREAPGRPPTSLVRATAEGVRYALRSPTLRITMLMVPCTNAAIGMSDLTLTAILLQATGSPTLVGFIRACEPVVAIASNLMAGSIRSMGRERSLLVGGLLAQAAVFVVVAIHPSVVVVASAILIAAGLAGPRMITLTSLVQRSTDPELYARTTSASTILGVMGTPLGSALAGAMLAIAPVIAVLSTSALVVAPALLALRLPASTAGTAAASREGGPTA